MKNSWLGNNNRALSQIKQFLTECEYKPQYDDFPLRPLQKLLNGLEGEVNRLQSENDSLKEALNKIQKDRSQQTE